MGDQKPLRRYRRYLERRRQRTYEEEGLMLLLGLKSLQELRHWFKERENGLPPRDLLDLQDMKPPDEAINLAMREAEERRTKRKSKRVYDSVLPGPTILTIPKASECPGRLKFTCRRPHNLNFSETNSKSPYVKREFLRSFNVSQKPGQGVTLQGVPTHLCHQGGEREPQVE